MVTAPDPSAKRWRCLGTCFCLIFLRPDASGRFFFGTLISPFMGLCMLMFSFRSFQTLMLFKIDAWVQCCDCGLILVSPLSSSCREKTCLPEVGRFSKISIQVLSIVEVCRSLVKSQWSFFQWLGLGWKSCPLLRKSSLSNTFQTLPFPPHVFWISFSYKINFNLQQLGHKLATPAVSPSNLTPDGRIFCGSWSVHSIVCAASALSLPGCIPELEMRWNQSCGIICISRIPTKMINSKASCNHWNPLERNRQKSTQKAKSSRYDGGWHSRDSWWCHPLGWSSLPPFISLWTCSHILGGKIRQKVGC